MRRMGYLAAAATGVLAPLVLTLPASAVPAHDPLGLDLPSLSDFFGSPEFQDDASDSSTDEGFVIADATSADRSGKVSIIVEGHDLPPLMPVELSSAGLNAACIGDNSLHGLKTVTDLSGSFNITATGMLCIDGTYRIDVTEQSTPYKTFSVPVTIIS